MSSHLNTRARTHARTHLPTKRPNQNRLLLPVRLFCIQWVGVIIIMIIIIVDGYCYYCTGFVWIIRKRIKLRQNKMEWNKIKIYRSIGKWKGSKRSLSLNLVGNPNLSYPILNHPSMALSYFSRLCPPLLMNLGRMFHLFSPFLFVAFCTLPVVRT